MPHLDLPHDRDSALFASLSEVVGKPINEYAFGDIKGLAKTIDAILAYDTAHPSSFMPSPREAEASKTIKADLLEMKAKMLADAALNKAERQRRAATEFQPSLGAGSKLPFLL